MNASSITKEKEADGDSSKEIVEYWYEVDIQDVHGQIIVLLNGFPVYETGYGMKSHDQIDLPMNTALVGEENRYALRVEPWLSRSGKGLKIGEVVVESWASRNGEVEVEGSRIYGAAIDSAYESWRKKAHRQWEKYRKWEKQWLEEDSGRRDSVTWKKGGALDSMRAWASRNPITVSTTFDNKEGPDFSRIFEEAPRLPDTPATRERLKDYAIHLRDLMAEKDTLGLFYEARPLFTDHVTGTTYEKDRILKIIATNWFVQDWRLDFTREEVGVRRWSDGRVWELYKASTGNELFVAGEEKETGLLDIYVAELDGKLRVVR